jgi:peptide subunit release factor 1 (eRF1)
MAFQRRADEHARWHLKHVAELMDKLAVIKKFDRLVLGGTHEVTSELKNLLSERLRKCVIASVSLPIDTSAAQILRETVRIEEEFERDGEEALVTRLLTDAAKGQQAVIGLSPTLEALNEGRIRQLIYTSQFQASGHECLECGYLINHGQDRCPGCGSRCQPVDDLLEAVAVKVFKEGGEVEHLKQHAADRLKKKGEGVGAYLRF